MDDKLKEKTGSPGLVGIFLVLTNNHLTDLYPLRKHFYSDEHGLFQEVSRGTIAGHKGSFNGLMSEIRPYDMAFMLLTHIFGNSEVMY